MRRGRTPVRIYKERITANATTYSIDRPDGGNEQSYGAGTSLNEDATTATLHLFLPTEAPTVQATGEVQNGTLQGQCLVDADVQEDDRLTHGGARYEVDAKTGVPNDDSPSFYELRLSRL
jgi:hypothetical protein